MDSSAAGFDATFAPYEGGATPVATGLPVALVPPALVGLPATSRVVALGVGRLNTLLGQSAFNASIVFEGSIDPSTRR